MTEFSFELQQDLIFILQIGCRVTEPNRDQMELSKDTCVHVRVSVCV